MVRRVEGGSVLTCKTKNDSCIRSTTFAKTEESCESTYTMCKSMDYI